MKELETKLANYLQSNYGLSKYLADREAKIIINRAVRFYVDGQLDSSVLDEDLYNGEDYNCDCPVDEEGNKHNKDCSNYNYPNLSYSEEQEEKWQRENLK